MIRLATFGDMPRLFELFEEMHEKSVYAGEVGIDETALRSLIMDCVRRNGGQHCGSTLFLVEHSGERIEGLMIGILDRVYHFLNRLRATDLFLYCTPEAHFRASSLMIDRLTQWAVENPKVFEIYLSWTDAISNDAERVEKLYARKGFRKCGAIWVRGLNNDDDENHPEARPHLPCEP